MWLIRVNVYKSLDESVAAELASDVRIGEIAKEIVRRSALPEAASDGVALGYRLVHKQTLLRLPEDETLGSACVKAGDAVYLERVVTRMAEKSTGSIPGQLLNRKGMRIQKDNPPPLIVTGDTDMSHKEIHKNETALKMLLQLYDHTWTNLCDCQQQMRESEDLPAAIARVRTED